MLFPFLLQFRAKQAIRFLVHTGISSFVVVPLLAIFLYVLSKRVYSFNPGLLYAGIAYSVVLINQSRRDKGFLHRLGALGNWLIFVEYAAVTFVMLVPHGIPVAQYLPYTALLLLLITLLAFLPHFHLYNPVERWVKAAGSLIPIEAYEWRFGTRKFFFLFALVYIVTLLIVPFVPATPFVLFYFATFVYEFYKVSDPKEFIQSGTNVGIFIKRKAKAGLAFTTLLFSPQYLMYFIFHFDYLNIGMMLLTAFLFYTNLLYAIALKYATTESKTPKAILFFITSPLLPLPIILLFMEFKKARCRVANLLPS